MRVEGDAGADSSPALAERRLAERRLRKFRKCFCTFSSFCVDESEESARYTVRGMTPMS